MNRPISNNAKEPSPQAREIVRQLRIGMINADDDTLDFIKDAVLMTIDQEIAFRKLKSEFLVSTTTESGVSM